jgi:pyruvate/2-oxoglutarate dehydrogenase complex dihydrolipoamide dehydrogenase (E3) component
LQTGAAALIAADTPPASDRTDLHNEQWRRLVFPPDHHNPVAASRYHLVVIGAGPAGLVASKVAATLGARVALIERRAMGGDCLNVGCVPSKTLLAAARCGLSFTAAMERVRTVRPQIAEHDSVEAYTRAGVDVYLGPGRFVGAHEIQLGTQVLRTRKTLVATGARPLVPPVPGLQELQPLTNETVFDLTAQPRRVAVLGGGPVGCELAQAFARLGTQVELMEMQPRLLPHDDPDAAHLVAQALTRDGVRLHLGSRLSSCRRSESGQVLELESGERLEADAVLVAVGRLRNVEELNLEAAGVRYDQRSGIEVDRHLRTSNPAVYAAGDVCSQYQFTHVADAHARAVIRNALFHGRVRADRLLVPWCTYTQPEVAHIGMTLAELERAGRPFIPLRVGFGDLDRGRTDDATEGYAEVFVAGSSDRILGATIVGKDAGEHLAPLTVLMSTGLGLGRLATTIWPYPTRSEYLRRIADEYQRARLSPWMSRALRWWFGTESAAVA